MQYVLALHIFADKTKEKQNLLPQHRHIYIYAQKYSYFLQMQNDPNELFYSPTD